MANVYETIPVPSFNGQTNVYADREIMASFNRYTQIGVTLAGGQGILPAGTVLAKKASDKKYYVYNNAGSGGLEVAVGVLRRSTDTKTEGGMGNLLISGILKNSLISGADSNALVDLNARQDTANDLFIF